MDFPLQVRRGLAGTGPSLNLGRVRLSPANIDFASGQFASNHILEMGQHYDSYVVTGFLPQLPLIPNLTVASPMPIIAGKSRATSVTGNIGEIVAAIVARRRWRPNLRRCILIRATRSYKTPDYMMTFDPTLPAELRQVLPANWALPAFIHWPAESKASGTQGGTRQQAERALLQLGSYWYGRRNVDPNVVGYGLIVILTYGDPRGITVTVIAPQAQAQLQQSMQQMNKQQFLQDLRTPGSLIRAMLFNV